jgi:hypothetical protein
MSTTTTRNSLVKPGYPDVADIDVINDNMDLIDASFAKCNWAATVDPVVGDDINDGYAVGSFWYNVTGDKLYIAKSVGVGAADWNLIYPATGDMTGPGSSTDHNLVQFNGTTGKVLEDSGIAAANVMQKTIVDAAGDLITATADNTPSRLAMGTANQLLRVNAGATALEWATHAAHAATDADTVDSKHASAFVEHSLADAAGDMLLASGDNTFARLAIGTNAQVLTSNGTTAAWTTHAAHAATNADTLDSKHASAFVEHSLADAAGDMLLASGADTFARLAIGSNAQVLTSNGTTAVWTTHSAHAATDADTVDSKHASAFVEHSLADAAGDMLLASGADTFARLAIGSNAQVLTSNGTTAAWTTHAAHAATDADTLDSNHASAFILHSLADAAGDMLVATADNAFGKFAKGTASQYLRTKADASTLEWATPDWVVGPGTVTSGRLAAFDGTTGKLLKQTSAATYLNVSYVDSACVPTAGDLICWKADMSSALTSSSFGTSVLVTSGTNPTALGQIPFASNSGNSVIFASNLIHDAGHWSWVKGTPTRASNTSFTVTDTSNANAYDSLYSRGMVVKWTESGVYKVAVIISSSYATNTVTVNILGDTMASIDSTTIGGIAMTSLRVSGDPAKELIFRKSGEVSAATNVSDQIYLSYAMYLFAAQAYVKTAGTTNATVIDINDDGASIFGTQPSIASGATSDIDNATANPQTVVAAGSIMTMDVDSVSSTKPQDLCVIVWGMPVSWRYLL